MRKALIVLMAVSLAWLPCLTSTHADLDPRDSASPYGVLSFLAWDHDWNNHQYSPERLETAVKILKESGVGMVRMDFLWDDIEVAPDRFEFEKYDRIVNLLAQNNIKILGLLSYNACWAAEYWNSAPNPALFAKYARAVAARYKSQIKYWEIWNEPDDPQYWREQDGMKSYVDLLKAVYPEMKKEDPTCQVLMGGVSKTITASLKNIYRHGGKPYFDIVNMHPFVDPIQPDAMVMLHGIYKGVRKTMALQDDYKEIWITEIGCPGTSATGIGWWLGSTPTEDQQAAWVKKAFSEIRSMPGVKKIFWAFFQDTTGYFKNAVDYFGLIRSDFSKKPSFDAFQRLTRSVQD